ncbi:MAG: copper resistance protein CopC [Acidobacteriota bacterium]|jgi:methionine-rich copper-binding protein CopC
MKKHLLVTAVVALGVVVLVAAPVPAASVLHLQLDKTIPAADQVVTASPEKIVLEFSEKPELAVSRVSLKSDERDIELSEVKRSEEDESTLWVAIPSPLANGAYTVSWTTSSADGHPVRGEFAFSVAVAR